jgi:hypothetical protein
VIERKIHLDAVAAAAKFELEAPGTCQPAAADHNAAEAASAAVKQVYIIGPEEKGGWSVGVRFQTDRRSSSQISPFSVITGSSEASPMKRWTKGEPGWSYMSVCRTHLLDATLAHHHDAVSQFKGFLLVVGHEDCGGPRPVMKLPQPAPQLLADLGVQRPQRLVQKQEIGLDRHRSRKRHALPLPLPLPLPL